MAYPAGLTAGAAWGTRTHDLIITKGSEESGFRIYSSNLMPLMAQMNAGPSLTQTALRSELAFLFRTHFGWTTRLNSTSSNPTWLPLRPVMSVLGGKWS